MVTSKKDEINQVAQGSQERKFFLLLWPEMKLREKDWPLTKATGFKL